ncbi:hypothetical protein NC653_012382 [Populus alba x Populus x berolinensis]|uniref:Uncharacterized protein n=1 Tax=Populus alba x Populus x berolinensis TaxID=444605 RepID=A0AAD6R606_9ROSI|nr:hypothetical protein NC653_012382 [Populus alba x Populus x berolinensis]
MLFGILNGVSIGLLQLESWNSILLEFYQMTKLAIIPFTVLLETLFPEEAIQKRLNVSSRHQAALTSQETAISSSNSLLLCQEPLGGSIPHQKERLCIQIFFKNILGIYPVPISLLLVFSSSDYIHTHMERVTESNIYP